MAALAHQVCQFGPRLGRGGHQPRPQAVAREGGRIQPCPGGGLLHQPRDGLVRQSFSGQPPALGDRAEQRRTWLGRLAQGQPGPKRLDGAEIRIGGIGPDGELLPAPLLVGLGAADQDGDPAAGNEGHIAHGQARQLRPAQGGGEAQQQHGAVADDQRGPRRRHRFGVHPRRGQHRAQQVRHRRGGLAPGPQAVAAGDPLHHHRQARLAQIERDAGQQMRGADRRQVHPHGTDRATVIGAADQVHRDGLGIAGQRLPPQGVAPAHEALPGRAVGPPGALAAGAGSVVGDAGGQFQQLRLPPRAIGDGQGPQQGGVEGEGGCHGGTARIGSRAAPGPDGSDRGLDQTSRCSSTTKRAAWAGSQPSMAHSRSTRLAKRACSIAPTGSARWRTVESTAAPCPRT